MVAIDKQVGKHQPIIDKRIQHTDKAGPQKSKREDDNPESTAEDNRYAANIDLFLLLGQLVKNSNLQKEIQGQGRRGDSDHGNYKELDPN